MADHEGSKRRLEENVYNRADNFIKQFGLTIYRRLKSMDYYVYNSDIHRVCLGVLQERVSQGISISPKDLKAEVFNRLLEWQKEKERAMKVRAEGARSPGERGTGYFGRGKVFKKPTY